MNSTTLVTMLRWGAQQLCEMLLASSSERELTEDEFMAAYPVAYAEYQRDCHPDATDQDELELSGEWWVWKEKMFYGRVFPYVCPSEDAGEPMVYVNGYWVPPRDIEGYL